MPPPRTSPPVHTARVAVKGEEVYLSVDEVCQRLGISRPTLESYVEQGLLTKHRRTLARRIFFKELEVSRLPTQESLLPYTEDGEVYLTVKEACQRLGISRQALDGYVERGQLAKYKRTLARRVFFKESEMKSYYLAYSTRVINPPISSPLCPGFIRCDVFYTNSIAA